MSPARSAILLAALFSSFALLGNAHAKSSAVPNYSVEALIPSDAPDGWTIKAEAGDAGTGLSEAALTALIKSSGADEDDCYIEQRTFSKGGETASVALIDIDADPSTFRLALDTAAATKSWAVGELGSPMRLVVAAGPDAVKKGAVEAMRRHVLYYLCDLVRQRLNGSTKEAARNAAAQLLEAASAIAPNSGIVNTGKGLFAVQEGSHHRGRESMSKRMIKSYKNFKNGGKEKEIKEQEAEQAKQKKLADAAFARSIPLLKKAIKDGAKYPPEGRMLVFAGGSLGGQLLEKKDKALVPEAIEALKKAIAAEDKSPSSVTTQGNRYNLACAYARVGKSKDALDWLEKSFVTAKQSFDTPRLHANYTHVGKDNDLDGLRDSDRYKEIMTKYKPKGYKPPSDKKDGDKKDSDKKDGDDKKEGDEKADEDKKDGDKE